MSYWETVGLVAAALCGVIIFWGLWFGWGVWTRKLADDGVVPEPLAFVLFMAPVVLLMVFVLPLALVSR